MEYWAKSKEDVTLEQHKDDLREGLKNFLCLYGSYLTDKEKLMLEIVCDRHDYGKRGFQFQENMYAYRGKLEEFYKNFSKDEIKSLRKLYADLYKARKMIPHGYLSPCVLIRDKSIKDKFEANEYKETLALMVTAIYYHHDRKLEVDDRTLNEMITNVIEQDLQKNTTEKLSSAYCKNDKYLWKIPKMNLANTVEENRWIKYALLKGMLNRLDYWASSEKLTEFEIDGKTDKGYLGDVIENEMAAQGWILNEMQVFMKENSNRNVILTASTGLGKTEGALIWANGEKLFYTLPLRVSINAIYERIVKKYKYPSDKATLLHSNALSVLLSQENEDREEEEYNHVNADNGGVDAFAKNAVSKMFCYPVNVCTIDQLFTYVFKYMGSEMLLATLRYSRVVIDEIQSYSPDVIGKLICGLYLLNKAGGKFAIMTATLSPVVKYFIDKEVFNEETGNYVQSTFLNVRKRHYLRLVDKADFDYEQIIHKAENHKVLVICNTVKKAQMVYQNLKDKCNCYLIHAKFIQKHKRMLENAILDYSRQFDNGVWIATQIVEASLDIDFDVLFTEMCSAESLLQRLGRCFRKREYYANEPNVFVYNTQNGVSVREEGKQIIYDKRIYDRSVEYLKLYVERIFTEQDKIEYINQVYDVDGLKDGKYFQEIQECIDLNKKMAPGRFTSEEAKKAFRGINSFVYIPQCIYDEVNEDGTVDKIVEKIKRGGKEGIKAQNELMDLTVTSAYRLEKYELSSYNLGLQKYKMLKNIKIISLDYDFDETTCKGVGLMMSEAVDNFL